MGLVHAMHSNGPLHQVQVEGCMGGMTMGVDGVVLIMGFVGAMP